MGHDAGQLGFLVGIENEPGIHIEETTRQGHGIDFVGIDDLDGEGHLAIGVLHDVLSDAVDVFGDHRIGDEVGALFDLGGVHLAHLDLGIGGVPVSHSASADVAIAHGIHVIDAAGLDVDLLAADFDDFLRIDVGGGDITVTGCVPAGQGLSFFLFFLLVVSEGTQSGVWLSRQSSFWVSAHSAGRECRRPPAWSRRGLAEGALAGVVVVAGGVACGVV